MQFESQHEMKKLSANCIHLRLLQRIDKWVYALQYHFTVVDMRSSCACLIPALCS